ncbi:unnamed protein product [Moneuplotes crassus]|uniref:Uncharacterized protein n=1 Tax=Euplotes crassus TaxID=5936 RepID=A0AAD1Y6U0_EUPCR|nr:unnamed protein product [Moneuplotes crassus]
MESLDTREFTHKVPVSEVERSLNLKQRRKREEQIQGESTDINTRICANLLCNIMKLRLNVRPSWNLYFDANLSKDQKVIKQLSRFVMPTNSTVSFCNQSLTNFNMKEFLSKSISARIKEISVSRNKFDKSTLHFNLVLRTSMLTTSNFYCNCLGNLNMKQLKRLFSAAKHTKSLTISHSTLCLPACPDFSDCFRGTTLSQLKLNDIKVENRDKTNRNLHELDGLISGLSKSSDLHKSIKRVRIFNSETSQQQNDQIVTEYGFPFE